MTMQTILVRKADIMAADMDGATVMMDIDSGKYYNLGEIGGRIWSILEAPTAVEDLITILTQEYDVTRERCEKDTLPFLQSLLNNKLISGSDR